MRKFLLILYFTLTIQVSGFSQNQQNSVKHCGSDLLMNQIREKNPKDFDEAENAFNKRLRSSDHSQKVNRLANSHYDYMIPVVIHVVHNGENVGQGTNISYAQIKSQIDALNAAFSNYSYANYLANNVESAYNNPDRIGPNGVDTGIRFCLAANLGTVSTNGNTNAAEKGVIRYNNSSESIHQISLERQTSLMNLTHPNPSVLNYQNYFNIWIVTSINSAMPGIEGYAPIPVDYPYVTSGNWPLRGVVIRSDVFGDNSVSNNNFVLQPNINSAAGGGNNGLNFSNGKILVHEIGHALGLYHTFHSYAQNGTTACDANFGDLVVDTPPSNISGLPVYTGAGIRNTCSESPDGNDMVENFMYYSTDNVNNTFTSGQKTRIANTIALVYPTLASESNLIQTGVIGADGCEPPIVSAQFALPNAVCVNQPIVFSNVQGSGNAANAWQWSVLPNIGVVVSGANTVAATITFPVSGNYQIQLTVTNNNQTATITQNITVAACELNECAVNNGSNHLIYGRGIHLDFSSGNPVLRNDISVIPNSINSVQSNFTQSDSDGNLLFYTDGNWVWNAQHQKVNSSNPISPLPVNGSTPTVNSCQQIFCVPFPGHPDQYVLLLPPESEQYNPNFGGLGKFRYAIIDTSQENISVSNAKTILSSVSPNIIQEQIAIIPHCNGSDYWVLIIEGINYNNSKVKSYLLNGAGIKLVNTQTFQGFNNFTPHVSHGTMMSTNRDGNKIVVVFQSFIKILDFDNSVGTFSNDRNILNNIPNQSTINYDAIFSPNGEKVYIRAGEIINSYNVTPTGITLTANVFSGIPDANNNINYFRRMFLGPDDQIYFGDERGTASCSPYITSNIISQLQNPDSSTPTVVTGLFSFNNQPTCTSAATYGASPNIIVACKPDFQLPDFQITRTNCDNLITLNLSGCYYQYTVSIDWGDNSTPTVGLFSDLLLNPANHSYTENGERNITVTLSIDSLWDTNGSGTLVTNLFSLPPVVKQVFINPDVIITGAVEACKNSQPIQYTVNTGLNGMYTWSITGIDNQIIGPNSGIGLNTINVIWNSDGQLNVSYTENDCTVNNQLAVITTECQVENGSDDCSIKISPNPVIDNLNILSTTKMFEIKVYTILGQEVMTEKLDLFYTELNLSSLQAGPYFIRINSCNKNNIIKIIKI